MEPFLMKDGCNKDGTAKNNTFIFSRRLFSPLREDLKEMDLEGQI